MVTYNFNSSYYVLVPSNLINLSIFKTVDTSAYRFSDSKISTILFSANYNLSKTTLTSHQFYSRFNIVNSFAQKLFTMPFILNKDERTVTRLFYQKYSITTVNIKTYNFSLRSKIQGPGAIREFLFTLKSLNSPSVQGVVPFTSNYKIERKVQEIRTFNFPSILSTGSDSSPQITEISTSNGVTNIAYILDGISAGIGDVQGLLDNEILVPIIIYVVINNGSFSVLRTARFEIRENNKILTVTNNGVSLSLVSDSLNLEFFIDKTIPLSVKIYRSQ